MSLRVLSPEFCSFCLITVKESKDVSCLQTNQTTRLIVDVTTDEPEADPDVEMPPPMAIQGHSFKASAVVDDDDVDVASSMLVSGQTVKCFCMLKKFCLHFAIL